MEQKLSAIRYIKNNRRRTAVLILTLGMFFMLVYITNFLLSTTEETIGSIVKDNTEKIQYVRLAQSSLGIDIENLSEEEIYRQYSERNTDLVNRLKKYDGVKAAWYTGVIYIKIYPVVGGMTYEVPLVPAEDLDIVMEQMDAELSEGRMPENEGEIVLDEKTMKNHGFKIGDYGTESKRYKIVGVLDCEYYFGCGIPLNDNNRRIVIVSDGIEDFGSILKKEGITVRKNFDDIVDYSYGQSFFKKEVTDVINNSTTFIYVGLIVLMTISLTVVYVSYLRERHNEWCLYSSIGFSRKEIYGVIMREILIIFGAALAVGTVITAVMILMLKYMMLEPNGIKYRILYPETVFEILCTYVLLMGILQIPIRYAIYRIRTVDAMDE